MALFNAVLQKNHKPVSLKLSTDTFKTWKRG